jgi:hypothetical protein
VESKALIDRHEEKVRSKVDEEQDNIRKSMQEELDKEKSEFAKLESEKAETY